MVISDFFTVFLQLKIKTTQWQKENQNVSPRTSERQ